MTLSFVIPCYKSVNTLAAVVNEIQCKLNDNSGYEYEIIMVSDNSPDEVFSVISSLCEKDSRLHGVELSRNFGQHAALMCGYSKVIGDVIISLDDDGQAPVESIFDLLKAIEDGADVVFGAYQQRKFNFFRNFGSTVNDWMTQWLLDKPQDLHITSFFAARRYVVDEILKYEKPFPYLLGLILRTTHNIVNVSVSHRIRESGVSGYNFLRLLKLWTNGFTAFSVKPLRIATLMGFLFACVGFMLGIWVIIQKLYNPQVPAGYSSIVALLVFIGGMLMLMLGLIGEYVGRIYICINKSPQYVIRDSTDERK